MGCNVRVMFQGGLGLGVSTKSFSGHVCQPHVLFLEIASRGAEDA